MIYSSLRQGYCGPASVTNPSVSSHFSGFDKAQLVFESRSQALPNLSASIIKNKMYAEGTKLIATNNNNAPG